jgi:hypothetical protein
MVTIRLIRLLFFKNIIIVVRCFVFEIDYFALATTGTGTGTVIDFKIFHCSII